MLGFDPIYILTPYTSIYTLIIFYPEKMNAFVFPLVKLFDDFSGIEYTILKKVIKAKGFDLYFATFEVNQIQA